jgi:hypothetical protein
MTSVMTAGHKKTKSGLVSRYRLNRLSGTKERASRCRAHTGGRRPTDSISV